MPNFDIYSVAARRRYRAPEIAKLLARGLVGDNPSVLGEIAVVLPSWRGLFATESPLSCLTNRGCLSVPFSKGGPEVAMGTVKWFNATKGYGFIKPDNGGQDVFVHISAVEKAGHVGLAEGAKISYDLVPRRSGKLSAENLRIG
jgi:cold shock protein